MKKIFEFGMYWDTSTFILFLIIGISVALFSRYGAMLNYKKNLKYNRILSFNPLNRYYFLVFFILWFFYTFKNESVGSDTKYYLEYFRSVGSVHIDFQRILTFQQVEPFYIILTKVVRRFTENYTVYFGLIGGIIAFGYVEFIRTFWNSNSDYIFLIPIIISYQNSMSGIRNALGITFIILSICALKERKYAKSIFLTGIGSLFHYTILINFFVILYYFLLENRKNLKKYRIILFTGLITIAAIAFIRYINIFLAETKYVYYAEKGGGTVIGNWYVILGIFLSLYAILKYKSIEQTALTNILITLSNMIILVLVLSAGAYRLTYYYALSRMNVWSYVSNKVTYRFNKKGIIVIKAIFFLFVIFYLLFRMSRNSSNPGFEYNFSFSN